MKPPSYGSSRFSPRISLPVVGESAVTGAPHLGRRPQTISSNIARMGNERARAAILLAKTQKCWCPRRHHSLSAADQGLHHEVEMIVRDDERRAEHSTDKGAD